MARVAIIAALLAGGNVQRVVNALISADKAGIKLAFQQAAAIDLAGRDVFEAVQTSVNPRVITTAKISDVAKDGIQLLVVVRITARSNINRLVGGATEETVLARVGEGIVSTIVSSLSYAGALRGGCAWHGRRRRRARSRARARCHRASAHVGVEARIPGHAPARPRPIVA